VIKRPFLLVILITTLLLLRTFSSGHFDSHRGQLHDKIQQYKVVFTELPVRCYIVTSADKTSSLKDVPNSIITTTMHLALINCET
jgi:hypothetical protein